MDFASSTRASEDRTGSKVICGAPTISKGHGIDLTRLGIGQTRCQKVKILNSFLVASLGAFL